MWLACGPVRRDMLQDTLEENLTTVLLYWAFKGFVSPS
jgi:hypothetical protein